MFEILEELPERTKRRNKVFLCLCECGTTFKKSADQLKVIKSCGCLRRNKAKTLNLKHGLVSHPLYTTWCGMRARCNNKNNEKYPLYGARGISVCKRWGDFSLFLSDVGDRPDGCTLDRIDNNGNYEPSNVRWSTPKEQANNRRPRIDKPVRRKDGTFLRFE